MGKNVRSSAVFAGVDDGGDYRPGVVPVSIERILPGESPRLAGTAREHVLRLATLQGPLPPILVDRRTMRVIDGAHRLLAAAVNGQQVIDVEFFDGSHEDAFLKAVEANVEHGLPLTQADRAAATLRILKSYPAMSDRAIAKSTGLSARAVAEVRRSSAAVPESTFRVGRDGKVRPLNGATGRLRAAELIKENPDASVRRVARLAGVSPATALDVRRRLERGDEPVPGQGGAGGPTEVVPRDSRPLEPLSLVRSPSTRPTPTRPPSARPTSTDTLENLMRDPSLRQSELGRRLLRMFKENELGAKDMVDIADSVPSHCIELAIRASLRNSQIWVEFAQQLNIRARVSDPE